MKMRSLIPVVALAVGAVLHLPARGADEKAFSGELELTLWNAIFHGTNQTPDCPNLILDLESKDGRWERVWGYALSYAHGTSYGWVQESETRGDSLRLKLTVRVGGDAWQAGGRGNYDVELRRGPDGNYTGTYTGSYRKLQNDRKDAPVTGRATARLKPPRPPVPADFVPVQSGEHPRVLFRKKDLPELRKKFATPFGKEFERVARSSNDAIALGVLYQLTGYKDYAMDALPFVRKTMTKQDPGFMGLGQEWGGRMSEVSLTYDLCYDAWPESFRKMVDGYLVWMVERLLRFMNTFSTSANTHPCSNYSGPMRGGGALGSLVIWGEKGPEPKAPRDAGMEAVAIQPLKDFTPVKGVPIFVFRSDSRPTKWRQGGGVAQRPTDWVWAGPLSFVAQDDVLAAAGGCSKARPEPGMKVPYRRVNPANGTNETYEILFHRSDEPPPAVGTEIKTLTPAEKEEALIRGFFEDMFQPMKTCLLFCYVRVPSQQTVRFSKDEGPTRAWLNGVEVFHDDFIQVQEGVYSLLVQHNYETPLDGYCAELAPVSEEAMGVALAKRREKYSKALEDYQEDLRVWKESGGLDPKREWLAGMAREQMNVTYRVMMGNGGFQTEGERYTIHSANCPLQYAVAYRKMFGRDVTSDPNVTHFPPRYVAQAIFPGDQQAAVGPAAIAMAMNGPNWPVPAHWLSIGFPIVPERLKPGVLWAWNRQTGTDATQVANGDAIKQPAEGKGARVPASARSALFGDNLSYTFLHYPLDMHPKHPGECFENTWAADTKGLFVFRNGWKGTEDIVLQAFLKSQIGKGHNQANAATFSLYGLGKEWVESPQDRDCVRWKQNVVMFPEENENIFPYETGVRTYYKAEKDGSGAVSVNLDFIYSGGKPVMEDGKPVLQGGKSPLRKEKPRLLSLNDQNGIQFTDRVNPDGIKGMRAFGVDYSGKCGAPMLLVLVDKIVGGGERAWLCNAKGDLRFEGNSFTSTQDDSSLKFTFVAPAKVRFARPGEWTYVTKQEKTETVYGHAKTKIVSATNAVQALAALGPDHFFAVATLQRGPAPVVRAEGSGLATKITIGARTVSFDGEKVVFGE